MQARIRMRCGRNRQSVPNVNAEGHPKATGKPVRSNKPGGHALARCVQTSYGVIESLNSLLRVELAAVAGYQRALGVLRRKANSDGQHILRFASDHQRTVTALHGSVKARGGVPVSEAAPWEGSGVLALTGNGSSAPLREREFVAALLAAEQRGLAEYEASLASLDEDARELVELELVPRQRRHVEALSAMLALFPA
jgi:hypothetical protein